MFLKRASFVSKSVLAVVESWHGLAQVAMDTQDIGLHRGDGKIEATDAESACSQSWVKVLRQRLMVNLFLWDTYDLQDFSLVNLAVGTTAD